MCGSSHTAYINIIGTSSRKINVSDGQCYSIPIMPNGGLCFASPLLWKSFKITINATTPAWPFEICWPARRPKWAVCLKSLKDNNKVYHTLAMHSKWNLAINVRITEQACSSYMSGYLLEGIFESKDSLVRANVQMCHHLTALWVLLRGCAVLHPVPRI